MHRLNGEDSGFLSIELPTQPMTSHFVAMLRPPTGADGAPRFITLEYLREHVARRLGELDPFRWRIVPVPLGLHHEVAVEDPAFSLDDHLHRVVAPAPGGPTELARISENLAARRLDRNRPLFEITLVDGLAHGRQALIVRLHHALMDGAPTVLTLTRLLSGEDHEPVRPPGAHPPEPVPTKGALLRQALRDHRATLRALPGLVAASGRGIKAQKELERDLTVALPKQIRDTPPCSLNDAFTARRRQATLTLALSDLRAVRRASGATITNVMNAVVAGALRTYLLEKDDLPDRPLIAGVPMAFSQPGPAREWGNHFLNLTTSLGTDIEDPWTRLGYIDEVTNGARRAMEAFGGELACAWVDVLPPFFTRAMVRRHVRSRQRHRQRADISVNISVLRGPGITWRLGPAVVEDFFMLGPPNSGCGITVSAYDYEDRMAVAVLTCEDAVPDPGHVADLLRSSLAELVALAEVRSAEQAADDGDDDSGEVTGSAGRDDAGAAESGSLAS